MLQPAARRKRGRLCSVCAMSPFDKHMSILDALEADPRARQVFERWGMGCSLCIGAQLESIESGAIMHGVDPDEIVAELDRLEAPDQAG